MKGLLLAISSDDRKTNLCCERINAGIESSFFHGYEAASGTESYCSYDDGWIDMFIINSYTVQFDKQSSARNPTSLLKKQNTIGIRNNPTLRGAGNWVGSRC
jgi:hypothetical protein